MHAQAAHCSVGKTNELRTCGVCRPRDTIDTASTTCLDKRIEIWFPHIRRITPGIGTPKEMISNLANVLYILGGTGVSLSKADGSTSDIWQAPHTKYTLDAR